MSARVHTQDRRRVIALDGAVNFRDLGGYPAHDGRETRWGMLFRADSLAELSDADHRRWPTLGIKLVCDFRLDLERFTAPSRLPPDPSCRRLEHPFLPRGALDMFRALKRGKLDHRGVVDEVTAHYRLFPREHLGPLRGFLTELLADGALPAVFHCTSGKDRTGFVAASILLALGVPRAVIREDYLLTNQYRRNVTHLLKLGISDSLMETLTSARPEYFDALFETIDAEFGTTAHYVRNGLGLGERELGTLRERLLS